MKKLITILFVTLILFVSCDDYLDEKPSKTDTQEIESVQDINLLLDKTDRGYLDDVDCFNISDDQTIYRNVYNVFGTWMEHSTIQESVWFDNISSISNNGWSKAYEAIWLANYIVNNVDALEGNEQEKANLKAEAHLIKAYKQLALAIKYCLYPNNDNGEEMGLPLKSMTEFAQSTVRASLEDTFEQIEADLIEGLKINRERSTSWRESNASAAALAARYYLYVHDFENAKKYAQLAISLHSRMINIDTEVEMKPTYGGYKQPNTARFQPYRTAFYTGWESQYKIYYVSTWTATPSKELLAMYQPEDLRLQKFYSEAYLSYFFGVTENNLLYIKTGAFMTGTDVAEMFLILAECAARNSDFPTCMQNIEKLRINRFTPEDYTALPTPASVKEAVQLVVDERRREFPFTSLRWYDIKRLNAEALLNPIILKRDFYEVGESAINFDTPKVYTLEPNSRKYARPLPKEVITLTGGSVEQNTY